MSVELLVNVTPSETRVALVENGLLQEVHVERQAKRGIVGNIYKGKISRVLPGMQAAFVDIGMDKAAFLHASDIVPHTECVAVKEKEQFQAGNIAELEAIAACVIGGTSLAGGIASVAGAVMGAFSMASLDNGMSMMDVPTFWQYIVKGAILLLAVWMDSATKRRA